MFESIQVHEHHRKLPALTTGQLNRLAKPVLQQYSIRQIGEHIVMRQMIQLVFSHLDLFGQFVCFNGSDDQMCVRLLQHSHVIVGRCLYRLCHLNFRSRELAFPSRRWAASSRELASPSRR